MLRSRSESRTVLNWFRPILDWAGNSSDPNLNQSYYFTHLHLYGNKTIMFFYSYFISHIRTMRYMCIKDSNKCIITKSFTVKNVCFSRPNYPTKMSFSLYLWSCHLVLPSLPQEETAGPDGSYRWQHQKAAPYGSPKWQHQMAGPDCAPEGSARWQRQMAGPEGHQTAAPDGSRCSCKGS